MSTTDSREEATAGCLPADQSCFALVSAAGGAPAYASRRAAARACCTTTSYIVVLGISFGSLLAILVILCVIRWYLVHRSARQQEEELEAASAPAPGGLAKKRAAGLDADAIAALPEFVYLKEDGVSGEEEEAECAVCLAVMAEGEAARRLPRCMHVFHRGCVDVWLREHSTCPVCRAEVLVVRPAGGECAKKEHEGSTSRPLAPPPVVSGDGERDLEAQQY